VNDSEVIKEYMQRDAEKNTEIIKLHRYIIGGFIMLLLKAYAIIFWAMKSLLKARDRDDEAEQKLMQHFITKKEAV
jgi:glutamate mutase epsilon subunit